MRFDKTVIHRMGMPYAVGTVRGAAGVTVVCATEDHGPLVAADPPYRGARTLAPGPGGCMALVADPHVPSDLYAVMGCFVGYKFQGGGIYRMRGIDAGSALERAADLPFGHRIGIVRRGNTRYLLAANLAADKKDAADWSQPGAVYAAALGAADPGAEGPAGEGPAPTGPGAEDGRLSLQPVLPGIHRNHGFLVSSLDGTPSVLIGCAEGLFALDLEAGGTSWPARQVLPQEVSEVAVADLDGDGMDELVTIEPFHGSALRAYRRSAGRWAPFWETEIAFGHCVLAEKYQGRPSVLVSNRSGSRDLLLFQFDGSSPGQPRRTVVEAGAAAANMLVLSWQGSDRIFSANQAAGELAMYTPAG